SYSSQLRECTPHLPCGDAQQLPQLPAWQSRNVRLECLQQRPRVGARVDRGPQRLNVRTDHHRRALTVQPSRISLQRVIQRLQRVNASRAHLRDLDVLASRALRTLSSLECDGLAFMKIVETSFTARGAVEEVLVPVTGEDEPEPLVTDEPLDRAVHR